jgi:regulator of protease activity HflC (stomatin/prohibitin superfamily)
MFIVAILLMAVSLVIWIKRWKDKQIEKVTNIVGSVFFIFSLLLMAFSFIRVVPAGFVGVVDVFGKVNPVERKAGLNIVNPFANLRLLSIRTNEFKEVMEVPSNEGLIVELEVSILYKLNPELADEIFKKVGLDYVSVIMIPQLRSICRGVTVNYEAKALYTSPREEIANKIFTNLESVLKERGIILEKVLLRRIKLPAMVSTAIENKLKREQEAEEMKWVLEKEKKEAERRIIEAEGIAKAQEIINKTLTVAYLQHEAIQAQIKMAGSPNHTVVYIPSGDNGIPLVRIVDDKK